MDGPPALHVARAIWFHMLPCSPSFSVRYTQYMIYILIYMWYYYITWYDTIWYDNENRLDYTTILYTVHTSQEDMVFLSGSSQVLLVRLVRGFACHAAIWAWSAECCLRTALMHGPFFWPSRRWPGFESTFPFGSAVQAGSNCDRINNSRKSNEGVLWKAAKLQVKSKTLRVQSTFSPPSIHMWKTFKVEHGEAGWSVKTRWVYYSSGLDCQGVLYT